jgi:nickel superoxide dismutase
MNLMEWIRPSRTVEAHCDLPCGIYDPEQARIEAESVYNIIKKYNDSKDEVYRQRAILIKEERAELAKHHLDVLWSDWYKPEKHDAKFPQLKDTLKQAVSQGSKVKASVDPDSRLTPLAASPIRQDDHASRESASRKLPCVTACAAPAACIPLSVVIGRMNRSTLPLASIRKAIDLPSGDQIGWEMTPDWISTALSLE